MKNKFTFPAYAAMATSFLTINAKVEAKAVYTDIDPDSILTIHEGMEIDFNEDGVWDVFFMLSSWDGTTTYSMHFQAHDIHGGGNWPYGYLGKFSYFYAGSFLGSQALLLPFIAGEEINDSFLFAGGELMYHFSQLSSPFIEWSGGYWYPEFLDGFIGVKLKYFEGGEFKTHYGWIGCSVLDGGNELVIKDYAYELLPDVPIIAGDTVGRIVEFAHDTLPHFGTGLPDADNEIVNASIYSFGSVVYISVPEFLENISLNIYNITGEIVYNRTMNSGFLTVEMTQPSGIYLVELIADIQRTCRKIVID